MIIAGLYVASWVWFVFHQHWASEAVPRTVSGAIDCDQDYQSSKQVLDHIVVSQAPEPGHVASQPKFLCYILTIEQFHATRCRAVKATWGARCHILLFASNVDDPSIGAVRIPNAQHDYEHLWDKHRQTLRYIARTYDRTEYDWLVKADDDTYLIMENLVTLVTSPSIRAVQFLDAVHLGHRLVMPAYGVPRDQIPSEQWKLFESTIGRWMYNSGGAGYVMNHVLFDTLLRAMDKPTCLPNAQVPEDAGLAFCLAFEGVFPAYSRDARDLERFHTQNPRKTYQGLPRWLSRYHDGIGGPLAGLDAVSPSSIGFHYMSLDWMEYVDAQLYACRRRRSRRSRRREPR